MTIDREHIRFIREDLIFKVERTAEWRSRKAEEYPSDARNVQALESLSRLARNLWELPEDHPRWGKLAATWDGLDGDAAFYVTERHAEMPGLSRYGFDVVETGDPVEFLENYIGEIEGIAEEKAA